MLIWSDYSLIAAVLATGLALAWLMLIPAATVLARRLARPSLVSTNGGRINVAARQSRDVLAAGTLLAWLGFGFVTAALVFRMVALGRGPFANMYEFALAFAWGVLLADLILEHRAGTHVVGAIALPVAFVLLIVAVAITGKVVPLPPALQNGLLLTTHVLVAIVAYGLLTTAFATTVLFLIQVRAQRAWLPSPDRLDQWSRRAVTIAFPFLTLVLVLGAVWAEVAWGRYWSWDPKETAALATWLIFAAYLHGRSVRGWSSERSASLVILGFIAIVFTFSGNLFFGGLHSYSGVT